MPKQYGGRKVRDATADRERFCDADYYAMVKDPIRIVRKIYKHVGDDLSYAAENRMKEWLRRNSQKNMARTNIEWMPSGWIPARSTIDLQTIAIGFQFPLSKKSNPIQIYRDILNQLKIFF